MLRKLSADKGKVEVKESEKMAPNKNRNYAVEWDRPENRERERRSRSLFSAPFRELRKTHILKTS